MTKIALRPYKTHPDYKSSQFSWSRCLPFVENSRGLLIHRPRSVVTIKTQKGSHTSIEYWCGNHTSGSKNLTFLAAPPVGAILCERCEQAALEAGMPCASSLAGRHVHVGKLKAVKTCGCAQEQGEKHGNQD